MSAVLGFLAVAQTVWPLRLGAARRILARAVAEGYDGVQVDVAGKVPILVLICELRDAVEGPLAHHDDDHEIEIEEIKYAKLGDPGAGTLLSKTRGVTQ
jgi:hypothetical protein